MKIIICKDEQSQITTRQILDGEEMEFSYVDLIKALYHNKTMEMPDFRGEFDVAEVESIKRMVERINFKIAELE